MKIYDELEKERIEVYNRYKNYIAGQILFILVFFGLFGFFTFNTVITANVSFVPIMFVFGILSVVFFGFFGRKGINEKKEFEKKVKNQIIENILADIFDQKAYYNASDHIPINLINDVRLVKRPDKYEGEDLISGSYGKINFQVSDITLMEMRTSSDGKNSSTYYYPYFKGKWYIYKFPKRFNETIKIIEEKPLFSLQGIKRIETEMIEFNNKFTVYATDEKFFYYLMNPIFIEKILKLEKMHRGKIYFCITQNMFHIGINDNSDMLKFQISKPITSEIYNRFKDEILFIKDIINILGLNELKFTDNF